MPFYGEGVELADPILPRQGFGALKQLVEGGCGKFAEADENVLGTAQVDICTCHVAGLALKGNSAVDGLNSFEPQGVDLLAQKFLQPEQTSCYQLQFHKKSSF